MGILGGLITAAIGKITGLISETITDKDKALELQTKIEEELIDFQKQVLEYESQLLQSKRDIIVAEAQSESWLTRNWRPITMLVFVGLIVADWLGFKAPNITPEIEAKLFSLVEIGLGGYVVGRSAEKIAKELKPVLSKKN